MGTCVRMYRPTDTPPEASTKPVEGLSGLPTEHLERELCSLASHLAVGMARWIALADEYDRRRGWGRWGGVVSTSHWVSWRWPVPRGLRASTSASRGSFADLPLIR